MEHERVVPAKDDTPLLEAFKRAVTMLKSKTSTEQFVGLILLRSLLDTHESLRTNQDLVTEAWDALPLRFFRGLLNAKPSEKNPAEKAQELNNLGIAVVRTFVVLLPVEKMADEKLLASTDSLLRLLAYAGSENKILILQTLLSIANNTSGAHYLLSSDVLTCAACVDPTDTEAFALSVRLIHIVLASIAEWYQYETPDSLLANWHGTLAGLISEGKKVKDNIIVLEALQDIFERTLDIRVLWPPDLSRIWMKELIALIHTSILRAPTAKTRRACIFISASFFHKSQAFGRNLFAKAEDASIPSRSKPFSFLFTNLILVEIRSTIPSLMELMPDPSYPKTAKLLAACYNLVAAFTIYLVAVLNRAEEEDIDSEDLELSPDELLRLRKEISETFSHTIEYIQDRYEDICRKGAVAGSSIKAPQTVAFEEDTVVTDGIFALSLWLKDDSGDQLRQEASSILPILLHLYRYSKNLDQEAISGGALQVDYRHAVALILKSLFESEIGVQVFLDNNGWDTIAGDVVDLYCTRPGDNAVLPVILSALMEVVLSESVAHSKKEWFGLVDFFVEAIEPRLSTTENDQGLFNLLDAWTICVQIIEKAPANLLKKESRASLQGSKLKERAQKMLDDRRSQLSEDNVDALEEIIDGLKLVLADL